MQIKVENIVADMDTLKKDYGLEGIEIEIDDVVCVIHRMDDGLPYQEALNQTLSTIRKTLDERDMNNTDMRLSEDTKDQLKKNARSMGFDMLLSSANEECAELIQAISKFNRARGIGQPTEVSLEDARANLIEELADVKICIDALIYVTGYDLVPMINRKTEKVKKRFE